MTNVLGVVSGQGRSRDALVFIAGRDDLPPGPGANDNGSGTGALVELARTLVGSVTQTSLVFASVDGTTAESAGARELARHPPGGLRLRAGIALRGVGRPGPLVLQLAGDGHRLPAAGWLRTVEQALRDEGVEAVRLPSLGQQVTGLVAPAAHGDQAALVGRGAAVVGLDGSRPGESSAADTPDQLSADFLGRVGTAAQLAALAFDTGPRPASLGSSYLVSSDRVLRGWTLAALPRRAARAADLRARGRRWRAPGRAAPGPRSRCGACSGAPAGLAVGILAIRLLGATGVLAGRPFAALRRQRRRRVAVADRLPAGARRRLRRAGRAPRAGRCRRRGRRALPRCASHAARRRRARLRRQPLSARARDPRAAPLAAAAR